MSKCWRVIFAVAVLTAVMAFTTMFIAPPAQAAQKICGVPSEQGSWVNTNPNTRGITRVHVQFVCQDQVLNGQVGPSYYVHLFGRCHPTDCDWGTVPAIRQRNGNIYAVYHQGFANRYVWIHYFSSGILGVFVRTVFTDPGRAGYDLREYFRKSSDR